MSNVGSITVSFDGDSSGLDRAQAKVRASLSKTTDGFNEARGAQEKMARSTRGTVDAVAAVSKRVDELREKQMRLATALSQGAVAVDGDRAKFAALREELEATTRQMNALTNAKQHTVGAASRMTSGMLRASTTLERLRTVADGVDQKMGRLQVAMGGVGDALGVAAQGIQRVVGGAADASMAFAIGGPLLAGATAVGVAVAALADHFSSVEEAARAAAEAAERPLQALRDEVSALSDELTALGRSTTVEIIQARRDAATSGAAASEAGGAFRAQFGNLSPGDMETLQAKAEAGMRVTVDRWDDVSQSMKSVVVDAADVVEAYRDAFKIGEEAALAQERLTGLVQKAQFEELSRSEKEDKKSPSVEVERLRVSGGADVRGVDTRELAKQDAAERARGNALLNDGAVAFEHGTKDFALNMVDGRKAAAETQMILERARKATLDFAAGVGGMVSAVLSGKGGEAAGAEVGATVGGLIGSIFGGAAVGEAIGGVVGSIMGNALDELVSALGVLTPLFDGLAILISALQPILVVLRQLFADVGELLVALAPIILDLARPIAALLLVAVRIVEVLLPFVDMILAGVSALLQFVDFITLVVGWLDAHFFAPLASGAIALYNAFVDAVNAFTEAINAFLPDELGQFGTRLNHITTNPWDTTTGDFANELSSLIGDSVEEGARDGVAAGLSTGTENLPGWYKIAPAMAASAEAGPSRTTVNVTIGQWISRGGLRQDLDELQRVARNGGLGPFVGRRNNPDERN